MRNVEIRNPVQNEILYTFLIEIKFTKIEISSNIFNGIFSIFEIGIELDKNKRIQMFFELKEEILVKQQKERSFSFTVQLSLRSRISFSRLRMISFGARKSVSA